MIENEKSNALSQILSIVREHNLSLDDIGAALSKGASKEKDGDMITRILGYVGAIFIFGGLCLFIGMQWDLFNSAARVIITYGSGLFAFIFGIIILKDNRYIGASTPLFLASAALMPTGMFVFLHEYANGDDAQLAAMIVFGVLAAQFLNTFFVLRRTSLLFFGTVFYTTALVTLMDRADVPPEILGVGISLSILMVAYKIDLTIHRAIAPFWYFIGGVGLLVSSYDIFEDSPLDILLLGISIVMMFISVRVKSRMFLFVSTAGLLCFLGYYTERYFTNIVGWPIALIIMGIMLVVISGWAVKLGKTMKN